MESQGEEGTVARITRAFDAAFVRFCEAATVEDQEDETSTLLHHLYRLSVAVHGEPESGKGGWADLATESDGREQIPALIQLRHVDVHAMVRTTEMRDVYAEFYTSMYGTLVWNLTEGSFVNKRQRDGQKKYNVIGLLDGEGVAGTLHRARHTLA